MIAKSNVKALLFFCVISTILTSAIWAQTAAPAPASPATSAPAPAPQTPAAPVATASPAATQHSVPNYEIYAIRYASIPDFPVNALIADADPARKFNIAMTIWLVRGGGHN